MAHTEQGWYQIKKKEKSVTKEMRLSNLFGGGRVLSHCLGTLRDGVLGKLTRKDEPDRGLDLPG